MKKRGIKKLIISTVALVGILGGAAYADAQLYATYGGVSVNTTVTGTYYSEGVYKTRTLAYSEALFSTATITYGNTNSKDFKSWVENDSSNSSTYKSNENTIFGATTYKYYPQAGYAMQSGKAYRLVIKRTTGNCELRVIGSFYN